MARREKDLLPEPDDPLAPSAGGAAPGSGEIGPEGEPPPRTRDLSDDPDVVEQLLDVFTECDAAYNAQTDRFNDNNEYWDLYNSKLGPRQFYNGNSQIFVPIVRNAVNARKTRFVNQLFPTSGRHVQAVSEDGTSPQAHVSLLECYIRKTGLRTRVAPPLLRCGDVEGQYSVYINWVETVRYVNWKTKKPLAVEAPELDELLEDPDEEVEDMESEAIKSSHPWVEVVSDNDLVVWPATADSITEALAEGGGVAIVRRWRKGRVKQLIRDGYIDKDRGNDLIERMSTISDDGRNDPGKKAVNEAGIQRDERGPFVVAYEVWTNLELPDEDEPRLCMAYLCGNDAKAVLGARRNPFWCDRPPILSAPVEKVHGSFKGKSQLAAVATLQYQVNDSINQGMDSASYGLLPIVMTDPEKNPRVGSMILSLAAIWETSPNDTKFAEFPPLWKEAMQLVAAGKAEIYETLSVNPARITQQASTKKLTAAEIASEQQVDMLSTADSVTVLEDEIFTPMMAMFIELDHQFREDDITVRQFGEMGLRAQMETVPPIQFDKRYSYRWLGVESSRNAQAMQQQIAALNVIRTIPPQQYQGFRLNLAPAIRVMIENMFGSSMAPLIFEDIRSQLSMDPQLENEFMLQNIDMPVHLLDNHQEHMQIHMQALQAAAANPAAAATIKAHILKHQMALAQAAQAQVEAVQPGQGQGPRGARPGAQSQAPRGGQGPAGMIHKDQMQDPQAQPRGAPASFGSVKYA